MPSSLQKAYGTSWGTQSKNVGRTHTSPLGTNTPVDIKNIQKAFPVIVEEPSRVKHRRVYEDADDGNYEIHINISIDQQDAHLICLFLGVFIMSLIFSRRKS